MGSKGRTAPLADLMELARLHGVETGFEDAMGQRQEAAPDSLLAVLAVLGAPVEKLDDVAEALRVRRAAFWRRPVEPVVVAWNGAATEVSLRLPAAQARGVFECRVQEENGPEQRWSGRLEDLPDGDAATLEGAAYLAKQLPTPDRMPLGYHRLLVELRGQQYETLLLAAPNRAYSPRGRGWERTWGVFLPLYALHSAQSWGAGDLADLAALKDWVQELGGGLVGTLPLMPAFLDEPFEISPYSPVSRLFWNEFYVRVEDAPELADCEAARARLASADFARATQALRSAPLVDYRRQMALKRPALEELARSFFANLSPRRAEFEQYVASRPYLEDYAAFRAVGDRLRTSWTEWPARLREGNLQAGDYEEADRRYHLYAQWLTHEQLQVIAGRGEDGEAGLYLDLPLGVNMHGYDVWRERRAFALGVAGGCPPDVAFPKGQSWGFTPLHPEGMRENGYAYVRAFAAHQLRLAKVLRIDHMPSFHRVFWIPPGRDARHGVYVRYPAEELYALFCLESRRHRTVLIGEDLGTVPPEVPIAMSRHNVHRMYVVEYEIKPDLLHPIADPPAASIAALNTHDMPPFAAFWSGSDIAHRQAMGLITPEHAVEEEAVRAKARAGLARFLQLEGLLDVMRDNTEDALQACLAFLRDSPARYLLVGLEDLWQETEPQNVPSTYDDNPNWRRKSRHSLEEFRARPEIVELLQALTHSLRR